MGGGGVIVVVLLHPAIAVISHHKIVVGYYFMFNICVSVFDLFCVEGLRPSQPNGVMSSAVSLPNHTFTGQA